MLILLTINNYVQVDNNILVNGVELRYMAFRFWSRVAIKVDAFDSVTPLIWFSVPFTISSARPVLRNEVV